MSRRILVLGGTGWVGRHIARAALDRGDEVTCLARGASGPVADGARHVVGDRTLPGAYDALDGEWNEVVDLATDPGHVASALAALSARARHWTFVSTVSVYARDDEPGADEQVALVEPTDLSRYPDAKAEAERLLREALPDRLLIVRPGLIVGPGDPTDRFGYWPARLALGGHVLVPSPEGRHAQVTDVDDLAGWIADAGSVRTGAVNAVGESLTLADLLEAVQEATGRVSTLVPADDEALLAHGVNHWAGPRSLPLWVPRTMDGFAQRDGSRYAASGGRRTPFAETVRRVLDDERARGLNRPRRAGLTLADEAAVLDGIR